MSKWNRTTRLDDDHVEIIESYTGAISDTLIIAREAVARLVADDLRCVEIIHEGEKHKITVRVRA
jgi:hypothetical protein